MVRSLLPFVSLAAILPALVTAHGQLRGVTIAGKWYDAPDLYYDGSDRNGNTPIRKGYQASSPSYLLPTNFRDDNKMACEEAGSAPAIAMVNPGDEVKWTWEGATTELSDQGFPMGTWVHAMGFTSTWIGSCNGDCKSVDASQIGWQKIDFNGLNPGNIVDQLRNAMQNKPEPYRSNGLWAMAQMIEDGSTYTSHVPQGLADGQYILRSEISAVHNPLTSDPTTGPQNYVGCLQIQVQNGGSTQLPYGTKAGSLYDPNGDFARYSVFTSPATFAEPGPAKWDGASGSGNNNQNQGSGNTDQSNNNNNNNNNGQQNQDQGNQNQNQNQDQSQNQNQNQGSGNTDQGNNNNDNNNNNGQQNQDQNQNQNQGDNNGNTDSGNSTKQCRRRTNTRRGMSKVARSMHAAKRHH